MRVTDVGVYETLGETLDDAAGEAFDKTAKLIGLGYPGGPEVSKLAETGTPGAVVLPRPMLHSGDLDFSFSGLKTAVLTQMKRFEAAKLEGEALERAKADLARGFVDAAVDVLVAKSLAALKKTKLKRLVVAGGSARTASFAPRCRPRQPSAASTCTTPISRFAPTTAR